jgi:hypothetical protein
MRKLDHYLAAIDCKHKDHKESNNYSGKKESSHVCALGANETLD